MRDSAPEVVISQLTRLPREYDPRKIDYGPTNRARAEGGHNLIEAAREAGVRRFVTQSVAFIYAPEGEMVKDEEARPWTEAPEPFRSGADSTLEHEREATQTPGLEGVVLRYGQFYGPGTYYATDGSIAEQVRRRRFPIVGRGEGMFSFIHIDDAASATVAALERGAPGHLQRRRRRARAAARVAARLRGGAGRAAAAPGARRSWRGWWRGRSPWPSQPSSAAPRTPRPSASWAGSRAIRAGARGFARRSDER